jgi:hypothetical protein
MKKNFRFMLMALFGAFCFVSCSDDDNNDGGGGSSTDSGYCYVINQGNWGDNDASLQMYDMATGYTTSPECANDMFAVANKELLGDVAQDLLWVGNRLFITVSTSQKLEVLDESGKRICKHVYAAEKACPRYLATDGAKVYVTNHDGYVYVYDAVSGDSLTRVYSGSYPEGISYVDGSLVVNNSNYGGYGGGVPDIAIIDAASMNVTSRITEGVCNPYSESAVCDGDVYIIDAGNYSDIPSKMYKIDVENGVATALYDASMIASYDNFIYFANATYNYATYGYDYSPLYRMDVATGDVEVVIPAEKLTDIYSLDVDPETGDIYIGYAQYGILGTMRIYDAEGVQRSLFDVGYYTSGARFRN